MHDVMTLVAALGLVGVVESFGLLLIGDRGPLWSVRPAPILLIAVLGTQILATLIAVSGILMTPLPWRHAALTWGYALVWMLLLDRVKLATYALLDREAGESASALAG